MSNIITTINEKSDTVNFGNELVSASRHLDLTSMDILFSLVTQIHKDDKNFKEYFLRIKDIENMTGYKLNYKSIKNAGIKLTSGIAIEERILDEKNKKDKEKKKFKCRAILTNCDYEDGVISAKFNPDVINYFLFLKDEFTSFSLMFEMADIRSEKNRFLFMFLNSVAYRKTWRFNNLNEICDVMDISGKGREDFSYLNRKYLKKAIEDINRFTSLNLSVKYIKKGRKVSGLSFKIDKDESKIIALRNQIKHKINSNKLEVKRSEKVLNAEIIEEDEIKTTETKTQVLTEIITDKEEISFTDLNNSNQDGLDRKVFNEGIELLNEMLPKYSRKKLDSKILDIYYKKAQNYNADCYMEQIEDLILNWKYPTFPTPAQFLESSSAIKAGYDWLSKSEPSANTFLNNVENEDEQLLIG